MLLEREARRHQTAQPAQAPGHALGHVADAAAPLAPEVMVVPLLCRLVANRLAGQRRGVDAALV
jgi:hypothetical protein